MTYERTTISQGGKDYVVLTSFTRPPFSCCLHSAQQLTEDQALMETAFHEAGHAVAGWVAGMPMRPLELTQSACGTCGTVHFAGRNAGVDLSSVPADDVLRMLAAGSQAGLLWLAKEGLLDGEFGNARGWASEMGGADDQMSAREVVDAVGWPEFDYFEPTGLLDPWNYRGQQYRAMELLAERWDAVSALAVDLAEARVLTVDVVQRLISS